MSQTMVDSWRCGTNLARDIPSRLGAIQENYDVILPFLKSLMDIFVVSTKLRTHQSQFNHCSTLLQLDGLTRSPLSQFQCRHVLLKVLPVFRIFDELPRFDGFSVLLSCIV